MNILFNSVEQFLVVDFCSYYTLYWSNFFPASNNIHFRLIGLYLLLFFNLKNYALYTQGILKWIKQVQHSRLFVLPILIVGVIFIVICRTEVDINTIELQPIIYGAEQYDLLVSWLIENKVQPRGFTVVLVEDIAHIFVMYMLPVIFLFAIPWTKRGLLFWTFLIVGTNCINYLWPSLLPIFNGWCFDSSYWPTLENAFQFYKNNDSVKLQILRFEKPITQFFSSGLILGLLLIYFNVFERYVHKNRFSAWLNERLNNSKVAIERRLHIFPLIFIVNVFLSALMEWVAELVFGYALVFGGFAAGGMLSYSLSTLIWNSLRMYSFVNSFRHRTRHFIYNNAQGLRDLRNFGLYPLGIGLVLQRTTSTTSIPELPVVSATTASTISTDGVTRTASTNTSSSTATTVATDSSSSYTLPADPYDIA